MKKIKEFLDKNGYRFYEIDDVIEGNDGCLQIMIVKNKEDYLLRIALLSCFDRWANSGNEWLYNTEDEVLNHLQNHTLCVTEAIQEYVYDIVEQCEDNKDKNTLMNFIQFLDDTVSSFYL